MPVPDLSLQVAPAFTVSAPVTVSATGLTLHYPVVAAGFTAASLSATVSVPSGRGTFSFATTSGLAALFGYASVSGVPAASHEIGFYGNRDRVVDVLANHLRWTGGTTTGAVTVTVAVNAHAQGLDFNPGNGHFYEFVGTNLAWANALTAAAGRTVFGTTGFLATITSDDENNFIKDKVNGANVWIGASDSAGEGTWKWMTGPEAGVQFWQGASGGQTTAPFHYARWNASEPNDSGNEDCAVTNVAGARGLWND